jgi:diadenosine tetraphosphate (Ap4A) HIT family hydrolase
MSDPRLSAASQAGSGPPSGAVDCGVCRIHADPEAIDAYEIHRGGLWLLRHHPHPAPLAGWLLLDARRHLGGPAEFTPEEAAAFGGMLQRCSTLVHQLSGCDRVYAIAFGEGARHLHLHLIPRHATDPSTEAWKVADLYSAVASGERPPGPREEVNDVVQRARALTASW